MVSQDCTIRKAVFGKLPPPSHCSDRLKHTLILPIGLAQIQRPIEVLS